MTLLRHELKQGWKSWAIWTAAIGFFIAICVFMYPEMEGEMEGINELFASMGAFTEAFGMDRLNFGTLIGFYAIECGNVLGIGGAFYAALLGMGALAKEEKERTAEFLLAHPIRRTRILTEKLAAVILQILLMNLVVFGLAVSAIAMIGTEIPWKELMLLHVANGCVQVELAAICFGISAFLRHGGLGIGMGLAAVMYFLNIVANLSEKAAILKYLTPFGYAEGADIIEKGSLDGRLLVVGAIVTVAGITAAYWHYTRKDIQ